MFKLSVFRFVEKIWQNFEFSNLTDLNAFVLAEEFRFGIKQETVMELQEAPALTHPFGEEYDETLVPESVVDPVFGPDPNWTPPAPQIDPETGEPILPETEPVAPTIELEPGYVVPAVVRRMIKFPANYVMIQSDITEESNSLKKQQKRIAFENFGKEFKRWIQILNEDAGVTPAQVLAIRADPRLKTANELAEGGDIPTLKYHIESTDWNGLFPPAVVTAAATKVNEFLAGWT
ncbi:hypothetical protein [Bdellovibrio bacteriovorus]|uniref:hypothetical protein n=1 Tax=Bdellovibrio bacteriovorus TaxID=959 RepID=UPI003AA8D2C2